MRSTFNILFYINRNKLKTDDTTTILCRITIDGSKVVVTTGESTMPTDWSVKRQETSDKQQNQRLQSFRERVKQGYNALLLQYGVVSAVLLKNHLQNVGNHTAFLLALSKEELKQQEGKKLNTYNSCRSSDLHLREFVASLGKEDVLMTSLTIDFIDAYRQFLVRKGYASLSTNKFLYWAVRLMNKAVSQQTIRKNPFKGAKFEKVEGHLRFLTKTEISRILSLPLPCKEAEFCRQLFLFSVFTGLSYADVCSLKRSQIETSNDGRLYIRKKRQKTDVVALIPLHPIAKQILSLFLSDKNCQDMDIFHSTLTKSQVWKHLKAIGIACGTSLPISFHQARHTFATLTLDAGVPIESIAKMLGHSSIASTQIYAQITDQKISKDMDKLIQKRNMQD